MQTPYIPPKIWVRYPVYKFHQKNRVRFYIYQWELIDQEKNKQKLQVLESIHIKMNQAKAINRKGGEIDGSWDKVIDHYSAKKHLKAGKKPGRKSQAFRIQRQERRLHQEQLRREQGAS